MAISLKVFLRIGGIVGAILLATFNLWYDIESIAPLLSSIDTFHSSFNEMGSKMASTNDTITIMSNHETDIPHLTMYGALPSAKSFLLLPGWLQEYFEWHREQTQTPSNDTKYVVLTCIGRCGGVSDRLRPLPFYLLYSSLVPRVLCIYWPKPFGLENYLKPPIDSAGRVVDWRCPLDVSKSFTNGNKNRSFRVNCESLKCHEESIQDMQKMKDKYAFLDLWTHSTERVNRANEIFQLHSYVDLMPQISQWQHIELMGDIFRVMFEPVPALAKNINYTMTSLRLKENEYVSVHVRSRYPVDKRSETKKLDKAGGLEFEGRMKDYLRPIINNAVNCASLLVTNSTMFFVSDSHKVVLDTIARNVSVDGGTHVQPVGKKRHEEPLHSSGNFPDSQITDFFPLFEDLLIMGGSRCVAHGIGSFGAFGLALSGRRCGAVHRIWNGNPEPCPNDRIKNKWTDCVCYSIYRYEGKMLFGSVIDGKKRIPAPQCSNVLDINTTNV